MRGKKPERLHDPALQAVHGGIRSHLPTRLTPGCAKGTGSRMTLPAWEEAP